MWEATETHARIMPTNSWYRLLLRASCSAAAEGAYNAGGICTICQDQLPTDASLQTVTACGHAFCTDCFEEWERQGGRRCCNCNQSLNNNGRRGRGPYGFGVTAHNIGALTPFAPGSLGARNNYDNDTPPHFYPSLADVSEDEEPQFRPAIADEDEEPQFRPAVSDEVFYRGAAFRSLGARGGADEPSAKRVCA